ncbi:hypothetical protein CH289_18940 [Rhodococcus sp. RS1C4]|nr:hypothetical protein CH289_18940 [Rhodococcus sp. RS1C4]
MLYRLAGPSRYTQTRTFGLWGSSDAAPGSVAGQTDPGDGRRSRPVGQSYDRRAQAGATSLDVTRLKKLEEPGIQLMQLTRALCFR